jgi:predicted ATP-binding protein involved in virulence
MSFFPTNCGPLLEELNNIYYDSQSRVKAQLSTTSIEIILEVNFHGLNHDQEVTQNLGANPSFFTTIFVHSSNHSPNVTTTFN